MEKFLAMCLLLASAAMAQPSIKAIIDKQQDVENYGGCSLNCAIDWKFVTSSQLPTSGDKRYGPSQMEDASFKTCWAEGNHGSGVGEFLEFQFLEKTTKVGFNGFSIKNGYTKSDSLWTKNSRVKEFEISLNGQSKGIIILMDRPDSQSILLNNIEVTGGDKVRLTIRSVYPGTVYDDVCISEIMPYGGH